MKRSLWSALLIASLMSLQCKKSTQDTPKSQKSQWTFNGKSYEVTDVSYEDGTNELLANDSAGAVGGGNFVRVFFWSATKPSANVTLTVVNYATATPNPGTCSLQAGNIYGANPFQYLSTGNPADKVVLTVSSSGKLTASFMNVSVSDGTTTKTVSGTLIEQ